jgi:hypothetical protein
MASIKDLKKDIKQMNEHFIQECYIHLAYSPPLNQENVLDIISDALQLKENALNKLNISTASMERKERKVYYSNFVSDFYDGIVELTERLNSLNY